MRFSDEFPDKLPCGIIITNDDPVISFINRWVTATTGFSHDSLVHSGLSSLLQFDTPVSAGGFFSAFLKTATGRTVAVRGSVYRESVPDGAVSYYCIVPSENEKEQTAEYQQPASAGERDHFYGLFGKSPRMQEIYGFIEMAAETDANVVIQGESGTGKELVAAAIHQASGRRNNAFVRVNCAALTETLLESELFGHAKGAFTGAYRDHQGKFEAADKGTIFLDEIGEISPSMQVKLLRVLQERIVMPVGDNREIPVDVRVVVATNRNLRALVTKGKFREDLFYRLNVFPILMPMLHDRPTDVPLLIGHFIEKFRVKTGKPVTGCSPDALRILLAYCWPGNVRELENTIEHAFVLSRGGEIEVVDLPHELRVAAVREGICAEKFAGIQPTIHATPVRMQQAPAGRLPLTREMIENELSLQRGNKSAAARALGISKVGLWKRMKKLGMQ